MPLLDLPLLWDRQPTEVTGPSDWAEGLGIIGLTTPYLGVEVVNGTAFTRVGTPTRDAVDAGVHGLGLRTNGSSSGLYARIPRRSLTGFTLFSLQQAVSPATDAVSVSLGDSASDQSMARMNTGSATASRMRLFCRTSTGSSEVVDGTSISPFDGSVHAIAMTYQQGVGGFAYSDGERETNTLPGSSTGAFAFDQFAVGVLRRTGNSAFWSGRTWLAAAFDRQLPIEVLEEIRATPWRLFREKRIQIWVSESSGGGVTGTSATTNANDTSAASGTTTVVGTSATTNANDTSAASGSVGSAVTGTSATTNANDTSSASGTTTVVGTSATTNANDTSAASGSVGGGVTGASNTTNADDTSAASGTTTIVGNSATANANDTSNAAGWAGTVTGTSATTNANDISAASGTAGGGYIPPAGNTAYGGGGRGLREIFDKPKKRESTRPENESVSDLINDLVEKTVTEIPAPKAVPKAVKQAAVPVPAAAPAKVEAKASVPEQLSPETLKALSTLPVLVDSLQALLKELQTMKNDLEEQRVVELLLR